MADFNHPNHWIASSLLIVGAGFFAGMSEPAPDNEHWIERGQATLKPFKQQLMKELSAGLQEGPTTAIEICQLKAPEIAHGLKSDTIEIGRTSHKLRNPDNAPREWMKPLLAQYVQAPDKTAPTVVTIDNRRIGYVEPIVVQPLCLTCHGENLAEPIAQQIDALYPDDQAKGFKAGDFRGIFWVEFSETKED